MTLKTQSDRITDHSIPLTPSFVKKRKDRKQATVPEHPIYDLSPPQLSSSATPSSIQSAAFSKATWPRNHIRNLFIFRSFDYIAFSAYPPHLNTQSLGIPHGPLHDAPQNPIPTKLVRPYQLKSIAITAFLPLMTADNPVGTSPPCTVSVLFHSFIHRFAHCRRSICSVGHDAVPSSFLSF